MHPDDARDRQIANGARVRISTAIASLEVEAEISEDVVRGSVNYPHGWGHKGGWRRAAELPGVNINLLASARPGDFEQVSGMAHLDGIPVTVTPSCEAAPPWIDSPADPAARPTGATSTGRPKDGCGREERAGHVGEGRCRY